RGDRNLEALLTEHVRQGVGERLLVLDHQNAAQRGFPFHCCQACRSSAGPASIPTGGSVASRSSGGLAGNRRVNVDPPPRVLDTSTRPPWLLAMCFTMARPSPVPPVERERAWSAR